MASVVALHLDLGHRLDVDRDALDGVDVRQVDLERHHLQREPLVLLPGRPDEGAAAADDAEALDLALVVHDLLRPSSFLRPKTISASSGPAFL